MIQVISASLGENGSIHGGAPGDQTGSEVYVRNWYNKPWNLMLRYPDPVKARAAAVAGYMLAESNLVGYNQDERNTLYQQLKANNFSVASYISSGVKTNCDCSSFVFACYAVALPDIRYDGDAPSTSEMRAAYTSWGFTPYTQPLYLDSPDYLQVGDVLVSEGRHTVIAWESGDAPIYNDDIIIKKKEVTATKGADSFNPLYAGRWIVETDLYLRNGPGILNRPLKILDEGQSVYNFGYFTEKGDRLWLYVQAAVGDTIYTGFCSAKYLKKVR